MPSFNQNLSREYPGGDAPFNVQAVGGHEPYWHDDLDRRRAQWRSTPEAQWPDGYLGSINTRREDRLLQGLKQRTTAKPYTRGVHKGERRDPSDYIWPVEFNLMSGLMAEARGERFVSPGFSMDAGNGGGVLTNDGKQTPVRGPQRGVPVTRWNEDDIEATNRMRKLAPPWGSGGPGMAVSPIAVGR